MSTMNLNVDSSLHGGLVGTYLSKNILDKLNEKNPSFPYNNRIQFNTVIDANELYSIFSKKTAKKYNDISYSLLDSKIILLYNDIQNEYVQITIESNSKTEYHSHCIYVMSNKIKVLKNIQKVFDDIHFKYKLPYKTFDVRWYFKGSNGVDYSWFEEPIVDVINPHAYPSIENIDEFVNGYLNSKESVLILRGQPGTGKTTLIRHIISKANCIYANKDEVKYNNDCTVYSSESEVFYTADSEVLESDAMFINFAMTSNAIMVLEDIDVHLTDRTEGNVFMYKLLGASDGLIKNTNRKIIISTNLENSDEIDDALVRKGRCYAVVDIDALDYNQAIRFLQSFDEEKCENFKQINQHDSLKKYTLANLYSDKYAE